MPSEERIEKKAVILAASVSGALCVAATSQRHITSTKLFEILHNSFEKQYRPGPDSVMAALYLGSAVQSFLGWEKLQPSCPVPSIVKIQEKAMPYLELQRLLPINASWGEQRSRHTEQLGFCAPIRVHETYIDENHILLLYAQMHHAAIRAQDDWVHFVYVATNKAEQQVLYDFYWSRRNLMPANFKLELIDHEAWQLGQYDQQGLVIESDKSSKTDRKSQDNLKFLAVSLRCQKGTVAKSGVSNRYDVTINFDNFTDDIIGSFESFRDMKRQPKVKPELYAALNHFFGAHNWQEILPALEQGFMTKLRHYIDHRMQLFGQQQAQANLWGESRRFQAGFFNVVDQVILCALKNDSISPENKHKVYSFLNTLNVTLVRLQEASSQPHNILNVMMHLYASSESLPDLGNGIVEQLQAEIIEACLSPVVMPKPALFRASNKVHVIDVNKFQLKEYYNQLRVFGNFYHSFSTYNDYKEKIEPKLDQAFRQLFQNGIEPYIANCLAKGKNINLNEQSAYKMLLELNKFLLEIIKNGAPVTDDFTVSTKDGCNPSCFSFFKKESDLKFNSCRELIDEVNKSMSNVAHATVV